MTELFQTERSAYRHPIREAKRLGDVPPAIALRAVAAHANEVLDELPKLARARGLAVAGVERELEWFGHHQTFAALRYARSM